MRLKQLAVLLIISILLLLSACSKRSVSVAPAASLTTNAIITTEEPTIYEDAQKEVEDTETNILYELSEDKTHYIAKRFLANNFEKSELVVKDYIDGVPVEELATDFRYYYGYSGTISFPNTLKNINNCDFSSYNQSFYTIENNCKYLGNSINPHLIFCGLTNPKTNKSVKLHQSVKLIAAHAFTDYTQITSLVIPSEVRYISPLSIDYAADINSLKVEEGNKIYDSRDNCNAVIETKTDTFVCGTSKSTIPSSVIKLGDYSFYNGTFEYFNIPENIKEIGDYAFTYCENLKEIIIPNNVERVGKYAYAFAWNVSKIVLSNNLKKIEEWSFGLYRSLYSEKHQWPPYSDDRAPMENEVIIPNSVEEIDDYAFFDRRLSKITFSKNLKRIGEYAFYQSILPEDEYYNITIGDLVEEIGSFAFLGCNLTDTIVIPKNVKKIGAGAFVKDDGSSKYFRIDSENEYFCSDDDLQTLFETKTNKLIIGNPTGVIPTSTITIGDYAFYKLPLSSVIIPDSVKEIGNHAFEQCENLTDVTIGRDIETIGEFCFYKCTNLTNVFVDGTIKRIEESAFRDCQNLTHIDVKEGLVYIGDYAFYNDSITEDFTLPSTVKYIGDSAFAGNYLAVVTLPEGLEHLGKAAFALSGVKEFYNRSSLDTLPREALRHSQIETLILGNISHIGLACFIECPNLTKFTIGENIRSIDPEAFVYYGFSCYISTFYISKKAQGYGDSIKMLSADVYFEGTEEEWISIFGPTNYNLTLHYNYVFE